MRVTNGSRYRRVKVPRRLSNFPWNAYETLVEYGCSAIRRFNNTVHKPIVDCGKVRLHFIVKGENGAASGDLFLSLFCFLLFFLSWAVSIAGEINHNSMYSKYYVIRSSFITPHVIVKKKEVWCTSLHRISRHHIIINQNKLRPHLCKGKRQLTCCRIMRKLQLIVNNWRLSSDHYSWKSLNPHHCKVQQVSVKSSRCPRRVVHCIRYASHCRGKDTTHQW